MIVGILQNYVVFMRNAKAGLAVSGSCYLLLRLPSAAFLQFLIFIEVIDKKYDNTKTGWLLRTGNFLFSVFRTSRGKAICWQKTGIGGKNIVF